MMKKISTHLLMGAMLAISVAAQAQDGLFISEIADPADDYTGRFIELFNAGGEAVDFGTSLFYLSRQSNGGTTWGNVQLTGTVAAGETYVIGGSAFETIYGFTPDLQTGILIGNGDDAYYLYRDGDHTTGTLHDIYGVINTDGTGMPWEYTDSRAERVEGVTAPNTLWSAAEWEIASANVADCDPGTHHGSGSTPVPGEFSITLVNDTVDFGQPVVVPVSVSTLTVADNIISYQFDIDFDNSVLDYTGFSLAGTLAEGGTVEVNTGTPGRLSVGYMNSTAITGAGDILLLQFNSLVVDTTDLLISNAWLNNIPVEDLTPAAVIIAETAPPTAVVTYNDTVNRFADTLIITATFSEPMDAANPVHISLSGAATVAATAMTRLNETVYTYDYQVQKADGIVTVGLSNGTDLWGNEVVSVPTAGESFTITAFRAGDVDDDGIILAYDAALTLQHSVGINPLPEIDPLPWVHWRDSTANVDGTGGITAYDAGLILQYSAGVISDFSAPTSKSASKVDVSIEVADHHILFYSHGGLVGLNLSTTNENGILGTPEVVEESLALSGPSGFLSAMNMSGKSYNIGLCTAYPPSEGRPVMKIPFIKSGSVTFEMVVNSDRRIVTIDLTTAVDESENRHVSVYPNPATDRLIISGVTGRAVARIFNIHGQLQLTTHTEEQTREINVSELPAGVYMIRLETEQGSVVKKFLKR
ncbi:MAG: T9SS type A sorting domain-containing protein [Bacteroidota bacterium]